MAPRIGVIGLGDMGQPMARHLLEAGYEVVVTDVRTDPVAELVEAGAERASTPRNLAQRVDTALVVVQNESQTRSVVSGSDGLTEGDYEQLNIAIAATVSPELCRELASATADDVVIFDIPLCRGDDAATAGELLVLAGGPEQEFETAIRPLLETMAEPADIFHMGELGTGQVAKTANNVLLWTALVADVEVFDLAERYGIDIDQLTDALSKSSGTNWGVNNWTERYPRTIPWAHKDMQLALKMAEKQDVTMPSAGLTRQLVRDLQREWNTPREDS